MLVLNMFAGPCAGKSATAAGVVAALKAAGVRAELVTEVAKDLVIEGRMTALDCQPYVFGKQLLRLERLRGVASVAVMESPLLLSCLYSGPDYGPGFLEAVRAAFGGFQNENYFIQRVGTYDATARRQTEAEALSVDGQVRMLLTPHPHTVVRGDQSAVTQIVRDVLTRGKELEG